MNNRKIVRVSSKFKFDAFSGLNSTTDWLNCMVRHEGYSSNEFERVLDILISKPRWICLTGNGLV